MEIDDSDFWTRALSGSKLSAQLGSWHFQKKTRAVRAPFWIVENKSWNLSLKNIETKVYVEKLKVSGFQIEAKYWTYTWS